HEFSHVLNGDMRLNIRLIGLLFGILLLAVVGRTLLYSGSRGGRGRRDNQGGQIALVGLALIVVGYIGVFFGRMIQAAVSRQREYLADAAAVQFTRNPDGIAGALKKIGAAGSRIRNPHAQEASHLFFATGLKSSMVGLLATHPKLPERIRRIDPAFDGNFPELTATGDARIAPEEHSTLAGGRVAGLAGTPGEAYASMPVASTHPDMSGAALLESIGTPGPEHVAYAASLLRSFPESVRTAAHDPEEAVALLLALLLHGDGPGAARQREAIDAHGGAAMQLRVAELARAVRALGPAARLPLLDLLLPALRGGEMSPDQTRGVYATAEAMVAADGRMDMFELALLHVLRRQLAIGERGRDAASAGDSVHSFAPLHREVETVLSALTWSGAHNEREATPAFGAGIAALPALAGSLTLRPRGTVTIEEVDDALGRLRTAAPRLRGRILEACVHTVAHDASIDREEAELLRAVAEALDIPVPPMLVTDHLARSS
ncbi:MAG TPA: M48 family metalloprotease, partial [Gemmatimonadaceae bacterium]|nr:M48 family metalloprotease [Gemmatimonadaceae bacterium]